MVIVIFGLSVFSSRRSIDCKHFDFGNGTCPFGTSCFYKVKFVVMLVNYVEYVFFSSGVQLIINSI